MFVDAISSSQVSSCKMSGLLGSHVTEPGKMPADDFVPRHV